MQRTQTPDSAASPGEGPAVSKRSPASPPSPRPRHRPPLPPLYARRGPRRCRTVVRPRQRRSRASAAGLQQCRHRRPPFLHALKWYMERHGWTERSRLFREHAVELLVQATLTCLDRAGLGIGDIDAVVAVSTTGVATPSLDALVIERLGLPRAVRRLPIFGLGCAGGVIGLSRAVDLARAYPGSRVLYLVVELCALTFRHGDN